MNRRWLILGVGMLIQFCLGTLYAWSVFVNPLKASYGFTTAQTQIIFSLNVASIAFSMLFAGQWQDKFGPRRVIMCGGLLFGGGYLIAGLLSHGSPLIIMLGIGVISGIGSGLIYISVVATGIKWFPERGGLVTGLIVGGMGSGTIAIAEIASYLIRTIGVLQTFMIFGIFFAVFIPLLSLIFSNPLAFWPLSRLDGKEKGDKKVFVDFNRREMLKTCRFWLLWFLFVCGANAGLMYIGILKSFGEGLSGITPIMASAAVAIFAVGNSAGRISLGWLSDKIGIAKTMRLMFFSQTVMMLALVAMVSPYKFLPDFLSAFYCPSLAGLSIISGWIGFNFGANFSLFPSATAKYFGTKNLGANYGVMFTGYGIGGLIGPVINGKIFDLTGSYFYAFIFAGALCIVGILLSMCLKNEQI